MSFIDRARVGLRARADQREHAPAPREIPLLFVYNDGGPLDERRLTGFAFRLRRDPPRTALRDHLGFDSFDALSR